MTNNGSRGTPNTDKANGAVSLKINGIGRILRTARNFEASRECYAQLFPRLEGEGGFAPGYYFVLSENSEGFRLEANLVLGRGLRDKAGLPSESMTYP